MNAASKKVVLVMDDSEIVLEAVRSVFEASGIDVLTAIDLAELEKRRETQRPDMFVLDVQMPEAFGDDIAQVLRDMRDVRVPILLFSSLDESLLAQRTREAGIDGYVSKAAGVSALLARVKTMLGA